MELNQRTWRSLLGEIIGDDEELARIEDQSGVRAITLQRWVADKSDPRPETLQSVLGVLSGQQRDDLLPLLSEDFPDFSSSGRILRRAISEIPAQFTARVHQSYAVTPLVRRFMTIAQLVLEQALGQLDPDRLGMSLTIIECVPPSVPGEKVACLSEQLEIGTTPWRRDIARKQCLLGAESLAGHAVSNVRHAVIQDYKDDPGHLPARRDENEASAAAYPILSAGRIAGCLRASSTQVNAFTPTLQDLIKQYANLLAIAFSPDSLYERDLIELYTMPPREVQQQYFSQFRHRVNEIMIAAAGRRERLPLLQAELMVRQQITAELLLLASLPQEAPSDSTPVINSHT